MPLRSGRWHLASKPGAMREARASQEIKQGRVLPAHRGDPQGSFEASDEIDEGCSPGDQVCKHPLARARLSKPNSSLKDPLRGACSAAA